MKPIHEALIELDRAIAAIDLITVFYNSVFVFLLSVFIFLIFKIYWGWAFLPTVAYITYFSYKDTKKDRFLETEKKTPALKERLTTVADNLEKDNEVIDLLHKEVVKDMIKIETSKFLDFKHLAMKTILMIVISFMIITIAYFNVGFDLPEFTRAVVEEPAAVIRERAAGQEVPGDIDRNIEEGDLNQVLGNKSLALLGKRDIIIHLSPLQSEVNLEEISDAEERDFDPPPYPKEIYTSYDIAYNERIPRQNSKVIKNYFEEISG